MKKALKITGILIVAGLIGAVLFYQFVINKPHPDYDKAEAEYTVNAAELYDEYRQDKLSANEKYNGKVIEIVGNLSKIEQTDSLKVAVFVFNRGMFGDEGIRISMLPKYDDHIQKLKLPAGVTLKAYCTGYNDVDVVLKKGSIVLNER